MNIKDAAILLYKSGFCSFSATGKFKIHCTLKALDRKLNVIYTIINAANQSTKRISYYRNFEG